MSTTFEVSAMVVRDELVVRDGSKHILATRRYNASSRDEVIRLALKDGLKVSYQSHSIRALGSSNSPSGPIGHISYGARM